MQTVTICSLGIQELEQEWFPELSSLIFRHLLSFVILENALKYYSKKIITKQSCEYNLKFIDFMPNLN